MPHATLAATTIVECSTDGSGEHGLLMVVVVVLLLLLLLRTQSPDFSASKKGKAHNAEHDMNHHERHRHGMMTTARRCLLVAHIQYSRTKH